MARFVRVAQLPQLPPGQALAVDAGFGPVALFNVEGAITALEDACLHCGAALSGGALAGNEVTCAACGWRYDVHTGRSAGVPKLRVEAFEVLVTGTSIALGDRLKPIPP